MAFWDYVAPALGGAATGFMMGGPWGAVAGAGVGALGYDQSRRAANEANDRSEGQAQHQMDFQRDMSSTAHQREVKDLVAAGLNPVLSATGGNGSSSPPGAQGQVQPQAVSLPDVLQAQSVANTTKQTANDSMRTGLEQERQAVMIAKTTSETDLNKAERLLKQKGVMRANVEGQLSKGAMEIINAWKRNQNNPPKHNDSKPWFDYDNQTKGMFNQRP